MMASLASDPVSCESVLKDWAGELFLLRWVRLLRPGTDGELLYKGLAYKCLLEARPPHLHHWRRLLTFPDWRTPLTRSSPSA